MQHFTVDTLEITESQFNALKAAAEAAGLDVESWDWKDRSKWPLIVTSSNLCGGEPSMRKGENNIAPLDETVTYPEALRRLAEASETTKKTPAQEAGFEVGDLGIVVDDDGPIPKLAIVRLSVDDSTSMPFWSVVEGAFAGRAGGYFIKVGRVRKLHNVEEV